MRLNLFRKKLKNPKTLRPEDYYQAARDSLQVPLAIHRYLKDFARQTNRPIAVQVDDVIAKVKPNLREWIVLGYRDAYLEARAQREPGTKLIWVSHKAIGTLYGYAEALGITMAQCLEEMVVWFVIQLKREKRFQTQESAIRRELLAAIQHMAGAAGPSGSADEE